MAVGPDGSEPTTSTSQTSGSTRAVYFTPSYVKSLISKSPEFAEHVNTSTIAPRGLVYRYTADVGFNNSIQEYSTHTAAYSRHTDVFISYFPLLFRFFPLLVSHEKTFQAEPGQFVKTNNMFMYLHPA